MHAELATSMLAWDTVMIIKPRIDLHQSMSFLGPIRHTKGNVGTDSCCHQSHCKAKEVAVWICVSMDARMGYGHRHHEQD